MQTLKFKLALAAFTAAALVNADGRFPGQPDCAIPCLEDAIPKAGCKLDDVKCQCGKKEEIGEDAAGCLLDKCSAEDLEKAKSAGESVCKSLPKRTETVTVPTDHITVTGVAPVADITSTFEASGGTYPPSTSTAKTSTSYEDSSTMTKTGHTTDRTGSTTRVSAIGSDTTTTASTTSSTDTPSQNAAAAPSAAKMVGGLLAGVLGVAVAL